MRFDNPSQAASAIPFLASDDVSYITGQALPVDRSNSASLNLPGMEIRVREAFFQNVELWKITQLKTYKPGGNNR